MVGEAQAAEVSSAPEVNVNTSDIQEPISKMGGESMTTFDELESVENFKERAGQIDNQIATSTSADEGASGESLEKDGEERAEPSDDNAVSKELDADTESEAKIYKSKVGDKEYDIRADAVVEVTVNGEPQEVNIQELMSNYSGKTEWSSRFGELDTQKKAFESEKNAVESRIKDIWQKMSGENPLDGLVEFAEAFGANPFELKKSFEAALGPKDDDDFQTDEEREAAAIKEENDYWKRKYDESKMSATQRESQEIMASRVDAIKGQYDLDDASFLEAYDSIIESNAFDAEDLTPEMVGEYSYAEKIVGYVEDAITEVSPNMGAEEIEEAIEDITRHLVKEPGWTREEIQDVINNVYANGATREISEKIDRGSDVNPESTDRTLDPQKDPMFFDDLENGY